MNNKVSWRTLMETRTEERNKLQGPTLVAIVVGLHVMVAGSIVLIQGCATQRGPEPEPPPAALMPPHPEVREARPDMPGAVIQPPIAVERAPSRMPVADPQVYEVQRGDNISLIASRHGVTAAEIIDLNKISDPNKIRVGQKLLLPAHARSTGPRPPAASAPAAQPAARAAAPTADGATYVIQAGDSLSRIASRHGVTVAQLSAANNISDPNRIRVGQTLVIPGADAPAPAAAALQSEQRERPAARERQATTPAVLAPAPAEPEFSGGMDPFPYTVRAGDTVEGVARDFAVLADDVIRLNNLTGNETLRPGQTLMIHPSR